MTGPVTLDAAAVEAVRETRRQRQERKRAEAEERAANVHHDRTKAHRLGRCSCAHPGSPEERLLTSIFGSRGSIVAALTEAADQ